MNAHKSILARVEKDGLGQIYAVERFLECLISAVQDEWDDRPTDGIIENLTVPRILTILRQRNLRFAWGGGGDDLGGMEGTYFQKKYGRSDLEVDLPGLRDDYGGCLADRLLHMWAQDFGEGLLEETQDETKTGCGVFTDDTKLYLAYACLIVVPDSGKLLDEALTYFEQQKEYEPDEDDDEDEP